MFLRKSSRLMLARLVANQMNAQKSTGPRMARPQMTEAECAHQRRIIRDLAEAQTRMWSRDRRIAEPFMREVRFVNGTAKTRQAKTRNEERSQNVV